MSLEKDMSMDTCNFDLPASADGTALATDDLAPPNNPFNKSAMTDTNGTTFLQCLLSKTFQHRVVKSSCGMRSSPVPVGGAPS